MRPKKTSDSDKKSKSDAKCFVWLCNTPRTVPNNAKHVPKSFHGRNVTCFGLFHSQIVTSVAKLSHEMTENMIQWDGNVKKTKRKVAFSASEDKSKHPPGSVPIKRGKKKSKRQEIVNQMSNVMRIDVDLVDISPNLSAADMELEMTPSEDNNMLNVLDGGDVPRRSPRLNT